MFASNPTAQIHLHFSFISTSRCPVVSLQHKLDTMLGKRGRPSFRRTTSMTGMTEVGNMAAPPSPTPRAQKSVMGGEFNVYDPTCSDIETSDFLRSCGLCNRRLGPGRDIYMYRGDTAFCSLECRELQMKQDERKERCAAAAENGEKHRKKPAAAATGTSGKNQSLAAA